MMSHDRIFYSFSFLSLFLYVRCVVVMESEEPDLMPETATSTLMEVRVH